MATIKDVAREAEVSASTVSHVINGTRFVAPGTAERVRSAIARLGFAPSDVARALKGSRTRTVGMVVTSSTNPFFAALIHSVESACFARGYSLVLCNSEDDRTKLQAYLRTLRTRRIDALVVMTTNQEPGLAAELAAVAGVPTVALDAEEAGPATVVADDSFAGGALAAVHLTGLGLKDIACITGPERHPRSAERLAGFVAGLKGREVAPDPALLAEADLTVAGGYAAMARLLDRGGGPRPQAVFCFNDMMAMGALCAAHERGLDVPGDLSVMGYDDVEIAAYTSPPLTTVRQPVDEMGARVAELLADHLETAAPLPRIVKLRPRLVERRSVGRAHGRRP